MSITGFWSRRESTLRGELIAEERRRYQAEQRATRLESELFAVRFLAVDTAHRLNHAREKLAVIRNLHQFDAVGDRTECDPECALCGMMDCQWQDGLHYHHDGCPSEYAMELENQELRRQLAALRSLLTDPALATRTAAGHDGERQVGALPGEED